MALYNQQTSSPDQHQQTHLTLYPHTFPTNQQLIFVLVYKNVFGDLNIFGDPGSWGSFMLIY